MHIKNLLVRILLAMFALAVFSGVTYSATLYATVNSDDFTRQYVDTPTKNAPCLKLADNILWLIQGNGAGTGSPLGDPYTRVDELAAQYPTCDTEQVVNTEHLNRYLREVVQGACILLFAFVGVLWLCAKVTTPRDEDADTADAQAEEPPLNEASPAAKTTVSEVIEEPNKDSYAPPAEPAVIP